MKEGIFILPLTRYEAVFMRSKGVFVPEHNKKHKGRQKYWLVESKENKKILADYRKSITVYSKLN